MDVRKIHRTAQIAGETIIRKILSYLSTPTARRLLSYPALFFSSALVSRGVILGTASPFGLAFSAACGTSPGAIFAMLGSTLGYLSMLDKINSLKYIACIILIYTAHFVFKGTSLVKKRLFAPCSTIIPTLCINLVFLADGGFALFDVATAIIEVTLTGTCAFLFITLRRARPKSHSVKSPVLLFSLLALLASFLIPLFQINLFGIVSAGKILAAAVVMLSGFSGGPGAGCTVGAILGCTAGLSMYSTELCMVYSLTGITAGIFSKKNRLICAVAAFATMVTCTIWSSPQTFLLCITEFLAAVLLFILFANPFIKSTRFLFVTRAPKTDTHLRSYASEKLSLVSDAFRNLNGMLQDIQCHEKPEDHALNIQYAFDRTAASLCKKCTLAKTCWERDYSATKTALNDATAAVRKRGQLQASDIPSYFSSRCIHIEKFVANINRELLLLRCNHQAKRKAHESKQILCRQYSDVADIFSALASDIAENAKNDEDSELAICDLLLKHGILCDVSVYRNSEGHANIHLCGRDLSDISDNYEKYRKAFSEIMSISVDTPDFTRGKQLDDIIIREVPKLQATMSAACHRRAGSEISGDSGSFFRPTEGKLAVMLSDGMGSGKGAAAESATTISLLESLLKSGINPKRALDTLNSALILKTEHTGVFTTLDLMYADMFTGNTEFFKFGSAPSYIKRGRHVRRITASSLPAGISAENPVPADSTSLMLIDGDLVIMASDGVSDPNDDAWLMELISNSVETNPKSLADMLLANALAKYGRADDMTIITVLIGHNSKSDV